MKTVGLFFLLLALPLACTHLPRIQAPTGASNRDLAPSGGQIYPQGDWQLVHAIEAAPPDGRRYTFIGVSQISSTRRTIHCVLMTLEGLVLFEAQFGQHLTIKRAVPPFDAKGFAQGLIDDLALIFLAPPGPPDATGYLADGAFVRRYRLKDGATQDIVRYPDNTWEIRRYGADKHLERTVKPLKTGTTIMNDRGSYFNHQKANTEKTNGSRCIRNSGQMPPGLILKAYGLFGYELRMKLVQALPLEPRQ